MSFSTKRLETWNRTFHFYLGLYFLFFLWLFSLSGLMLNHGQWRVSLAATDGPSSVPSGQSNRPSARPRRIEPDTSCCSLASSVNSTCRHNVLVS